MSLPSTEYFSALEPLLGPEGKDLSDPAALETLRAGLRQAVEQKQGAALVSHLRSLARESGIHVARTFLEASLASDAGDGPTADTLFHSVSEKLNQMEAWPVLSAVALEWLERSADHRAARYIVRVWKHSREAVAEATLRRAHETFPDDAEISWCLGLQLESQGPTREGRRLLASTLKPLAAEKDVSRLEEGILRLLDAPETSVIHHALDAADTLAHHPGEGKNAAGIFEMILPGVLSHGLAEAAWGVARRALEKHPAENSWRPLAIEVLKVARASVPSIERMIDVSGLERLAVPPAEALATLDRTLPYAPGYYVEHSGWGLGEIVDNDGEFLTINFPTRPGHRMNLKAASQVLTSLPADDLNVLTTIDLPGLKRMAAEDPAGLVLIALKRAGGPAGAPEIRKLLVPTVIATGEWSGWWKKIRDVLVADPRIDSRQKFRDVYGVATPGIEEEFELPTIEEPRGIDHNIDLIYNFLDHHPSAADQVQEAFLDRVRRWAERKTAPAAERARALLLLIRWEPSRKTECEEAVRDLFAQDLDLSAAGAIGEQSVLLDIGLEGPSREAALTTGLNGRSAQLRDRAFAALFARPGPEPVQFATRLLAEPSANIEAVFLVADKAAARPGEGDERIDQLLWPALIALIDLLNVTGREPVRKKGLKLLDARSNLMIRAREVPPDERTESILTARLRDWRASDKVLFPILESFSEIGLETVVNSVREKRSAAHARLFQAAPDPNDIQIGAVIMTRHTFDTLSSELARINLELKTTIPQAIRKARELGDLRENAEYEAAKLKQANASKRLAQLDAQLNKVRILEDLPVEEGKAGPGTQVTVKDDEDGSEATYWILGEGDHDYGAGVISYRAPLGRALTGRKVGDVVDYPNGDRVRKLRIVSVVTRKPAGPPARSAGGQHEI